MASKTTNYGLNKHSPQDFYNVEARNENWDKIDEVLGTHTSNKSNPHEVTAEQIGSTIDYGLIAPENLQTWASEQKIGGTFMLTAQTAKGVPNTRRWRGLLVCSGDYEYADRALLLFGGDEVEICNTASGK